MDTQFMHFWNKIDSQYFGVTSAVDVWQLRDNNPVAAELSKDFNDWSGLCDFLYERNTKLAVLKCQGQAGKGGFKGAFKDAFENKGFLKAAASKLECWILFMWGARLGREEMESLGAAFAGLNNPSALVLDNCYWDPPEFAEFLVSHLKHLRITAASSCDWTQVGEGLESPESTLQDISVVHVAPLPNLKWLMRKHCKLRRLDFRCGAIPKELVQVLQSQLEGLQLTVHGESQELVLADALKASSSLWFLQVNKLSRHLVHAGILKAQKLSHLVLQIDNPGHLFGNPIVSKLLGSPDCRLRSFIIRTETEAELDPRLLWEFQEDVLNTLEGNHHSQLQELHLLRPWKSESLDLRCTNLLYRNSLSKDSLGKCVRDFGQPGRVLKLFMCGHTGVGKTTIATNLVRSSAIPVPASLQRHASTQGITLRNHEIGDDKTLAIFDLAGQEVYHAFHHYFIRRTENDLFLIVCKVDKNNGADPEQNLEQLKRLLTYWLRFIVSHQSAQADRRPKVFVVLNRFCKRAELEYNTLQAANEVLEHFSTKVSLMNPVLEVVALKPKQLSELKGRLKSLAKATAQHLPPVPKICSKLMNIKARKWYQMGSAALGAKTIFQLEELKSLLPRWLLKSEGEIEPINALKFAMICLHNMGEAIYFGSSQDVHEVLANHVILDVQWFVQDIIGKFIPQLPRNDDGCGEKAIIDTNPLHEKLRRLLAPDQEDPDQRNKVLIIVKYLEEMGVIIPHWGDGHSVIIPTLLNKKFTGWADGDGRRYRYWGRRMQPQEEDREFTLLPSGVFSIIQADIAKLCKNWHNQQSLGIGDGWISFTQNSVKVLVLVGGENEKWTDRQWVDIMLMVPEDNIRCAEAGTILCCVRDCIFNLRQACPFLRIEEHVLKPEKVKAILHGAPNFAVQAILLDHLIGMARAHGLDFHHSWDTHSDSCVGELLMLSELKQLVQSRQSVVDDFNSIAPVYELKQSTAAIPEFADPENKKLAEYLTGILQGHFQQLEGHFQQLEVSMGTVLDTLRRMEHSFRMKQEEILSGISQMLQHIQVPKFPYFTDEKSFFLKYSNPTGKRVSIHYMCESAQLKHPMHHNKYEGVPITIAHDWIEKYMNVLVPAMTVSFFITKLGAALIGTPVKDVLDVVQQGLEQGLKSSLAFKGNLKANINSCFGKSVDIRQPAQHEVEEVLEHVKKAAGEQNLTVLMAKYFGLSFHEGEGAWVCDKHGGTPKV